MIESQNIPNKKVIHKKFTKESIKFADLVISRTTSAANSKSQPTHSEVSRLKTKSLKI